MHVTLNACGMGWTSEGTSAAVQSTSMRKNDEEYGHHRDIQIE